MSTQRKLIIIGGKGNGTTAADVLKDINAAGNGGWELLGFANDSHAPGDTLDGYPTLGKPEDVITRHLRYPECDFFYMFIGPRVTIPRVARLKQLMALGLTTDRFATLVHPTATLASGVALGRGVFISAHTYLGLHVRTGDHVSVHNNCSIGRDVRLEDYSFVAPGACLGVEERIGTGAFVGAGSTTLERITIGAWSLVGMGSVVIRDVPDYAIVAGNPARAIGSVAYRWADDTQTTFCEQQEARPPVR